MSVAALVRDDEPLPAGDAEVEEAVFAAAVMTATAFRLRDEEGLLLALRRLVQAVERLDGRAAEASLPPTLRRDEI